jgi:hypothetical protein
MGALNGVTFPEWGARREASNGAEFVRTALLWV